MVPEHVINNTHPASSSRRVSPSKLGTLSISSATTASINNSFHNQSLGQNITNSDSPSEIVELSPDERYIRFKDIITNTKNLQLSYKAFDTTNGIEIAWHKISLSSFENKDYEKFIACIDIVNSLSCENIVEYQATWFSKAFDTDGRGRNIVNNGNRHIRVDDRDEYQYLNIITTHLESLSEFIGKVKTLKWKIVKKWCKHVLQGLKVLHQQDPPFLHCNLSCSHIYIDGTSGKITIGDIWLSTVLGVSHPQNSPFRAVEVIGEQLSTDPKVDIYSFGITVLEMISREASFLNGQICTSNENANGFDHSTILSRIKNDSAVAFIKLCLNSNPVERPSAIDLLSHDFLVSNAYDDEQVVLSSIPKIKSRNDLGGAVSSHTSKDSCTTEPGVTGAPSITGESLANKIAIDARSSCSTYLSELVKLISISKVEGRPNEIFMQISLSAKLFSDGCEPSDKEVEFSFDSVNENIETVIVEMVQELGLKIAVDELALLVGSFVASFFSQSMKVPPSLATPHLNKTVLEVVGSSISIVVEPLGTARSIDSCRTTNAPSISSNISQPISRQSSVEDSDVGNFPCQISTSASSTPSKPISRSAAISPTTIAIPVGTQHNVPICANPSQIANDVKNSVVPSVEIPSFCVGTIAPTEISVTTQTVHVTSQVELSANEENRKNVSTGNVDVSKNCYVRAEINPADFADDLILTQFLEKNDQEARAARRAFETRIQKLMSIQEKCREDLQKLKSDLQLKNNDFSKKEDLATNKKNQDLKKLSSEFDASVKILRTKLANNRKL